MSCNHFLCHQVEFNMNLTFISFKKYFLAKLVFFIFWSFREITSEEIILRTDIAEQINLYQNNPQILS